MYFFFLCGVLSSCHMYEFHDRPLSVGGLRRQRYSIFSQFQRGFPTRFYFRVGGGGVEHPIYYLDIFSMLECSQSGVTD